MKAIDVDKIDWADGCFFDTDGTPIPIHHKIATIEMLRDWQPSCEEEIRADERAKTIKEVNERYNGDLGSFGFWLYEQMENYEQKEQE